MSTVAGFYMAFSIGCTSSQSPLYASSLILLSPLCLHNVAIPPALCFGDPLFLHSHSRYSTSVALQIVAHTVRAFLTIWGSILN